MDAMKAKLDQLRELMGDSYLELLGAYLEDAPVRIKIIEQAIEDNDLDKVAREAHTFKGSSSNMGAMKLASLCDDLEKYSSSGLHGQLTEKISQLHDHFRAVEQLLRTEMESC